MGLLGFGSSSAGALDVGSVKATLGYDHDRRGLVLWDREVDRARRDARNPIEQKLKGDYDRRGFDQYDRATSKAHRNTTLFGRAAGVAGTGLMALGRGAVVAGGAAGVAFVIGTRKAIEASSDLNESVNASNAIFEKNGREIQKWSEGTADSFGLARSEALQGASSIGAMLKPMGFGTDAAAKMSMKMVELAGDMASFNNQDPTEMLERIRSGLAGESEPLRQFGVDLRVAAVEQFALNKGLIEEGEKLEGSKFARAAYLKILSDTVDQQGDFGRTSEGMANAQRRLRANVIDLGAAYGSALRPLVQGAIGDLNDFVLEMKEGRGEGGKFADFLVGIGHDVEGFANKIGDVLSNDALQPGEKAERIFGMFADVAGDAIEAGVPKIANAAAEAAPQVAARFVRAFIAADSWGRLALGAFLLTKLGGAGALRGTGGKLGGGLSEGIIGGILGGAGGGKGGKGGGLASRLGGLLAAAGPVAKRLGVIGLGLTIGDSVMSAIDRRIREGSEDMGTALEAMTEDVGIGPLKFDVNALGFEADTLQAENLKGLYEGMLQTRVQMSVVSEREREEMARSVDLTGRAVELRDRMFRLLKQGRGLGVGVDLSMDPKKLNQIRTDLRRLRNGVFTNGEDIERASKRTARTIEQQFGKGTKEARHLTAQNLRATAAAFGKNMKESGNVTEAGLRRIKKMIRTANLLEGLHPREFGRQFAAAFGEAGRVTDEQLDKIVVDFGKLPKGVRQSAWEAMQGQLRELRKGGKLSRDEVKRVRSRMFSEFGGLKSDAVGSTFDLVKGSLLNFGAFGNGIAAGLKIVQENLNEGLGAFNVDPVKWVVKTVGNLVGSAGKTQKKARGGFLTGPSRDDVVPVLAGRDEAFVTSWQQRPIETALQVSNAVGAQPYPSLAALFSGETKTHSSGPPVRRARGGFTGPYHTRSDVLGSGPGFIPYMNYLNSMFGPLNVISGLRPGSITTSGNVSNHDWGGAVDISTPGVEGVTGPGDLAAAPADAVRRMDAAHSFIGSHFAPMLLDFLWRTFVGGNHYNHIHSGIDRAYSFDAQRMMEYISHLPQGGNFGPIKRVLLQGPEGPLRDMGQAQLDRVRDAANKWRSQQVGFGISPFAGDPHATSMTIRGRATWFEGGATAGGSDTSRPGLALNLDPSKEPGGWDNETTDAWMAASIAGHPYYARTTVGGKSALLPITDKGPASWTGNQVDVTVGGVRKLGFTTSTFPSGTIGTAEVLAKASRGGIVGKILDKYKELGQTKKPGERDEIRDEIKKLEERLRRRRKKKRAAHTRKIKTRGVMEGFEKQITERQDDVSKLEEQIGGLEIAHGLTEPREVEQILREMGLDPETDLAGLSDQQKQQVRDAIEQDYGGEEREIGLERDYNGRQLKALLSLRRVLLSAIKEGERRIRVAEKKQKKAEEEKERLEKLARQVEKELEALQDELGDLGRGKAPKRQKGESKADYEKKVDAWQKDHARYKKETQEKIERGQFRLRDIKERAQGWGSIAGAQKATVSNLNEFLGEDVRPNLVDVQGTDRSLDPNVVLRPITQGPPQFGGQILDSQAKLAELESEEFIRPDPFRSADGGGGEASQLQQEKLELTEAELARYKRNEKVMAAQAPIFAAAQGFPRLLARGGYALAGAMAPFVGSFRVGTQFVPRDGLAFVHRGEEIRSKERVAEARPPAVYLLLDGDLAPLADLIDAHIVDELEARGRKAKAATRRPATGVIARRSG